MSEDVEDYAPDVIRSANEVARRALALFAAVGLALGAERPAVWAWLAQHDLRKDLSPRELAFVDTPEPSRKQFINWGWEAECLIVLVWALGLVKKLPNADEQCDAELFQEVLPPYAEISVADFLRKAALRRDSEILDMQDACFRLHWEARDAQIKGRKPREAVDIEIIQERHRAINWVCGYENRLEWDEVTADT